MADTGQKMNREDVDILRLNGSFYSVNKLIDQTTAFVLPPSKAGRVATSLLFFVFAVGLNLLGFRIGGVWALILALFIHEFGFFVGMRCVGWKDAKFDVGILGPIAYGGEGKTAGRKAVVALSGPAVGLMAGMAVAIGANYTDAVFLQELSRSVLLMSALNLLPFKPFSGYDVLSHLLFLRHPRFQMAYLILSGLFLFILFWVVIYADANVFFIFFFGFQMSPMFMNVRKVDNMSDMIVRLRKEGEEDYLAGHYSPRTIKRMKFSLEMFDLENEASVVLFLRELWGKAWDIPATFRETLFVLLMYTALILSCFLFPDIQELTFGILKLVGFSGGS